MKKTIALLLVFSLMFAVLVPGIPAVSATETAIPGDIDGDGYVTPRDARSALRFASKLDSYSDEELAAGDVDGDNKMQSTDARTILRWAAELDGDTTLPAVTGDQYPKVSAVSDSSEVYVGDQFEVSVIVNDSDGMECGAVWLSFDPSLVELISTKTGSTKATVAISGNAYDIDTANSDGMIHNAFIYMKSETSNSVSIYTATFKAIGAGNAEFGFVGEKLYELAAGNAASVQITANISGTCGDDLTWTLDPEGVLTISGTGEMADYSSMNPPYYQYRDRITEAVIESGVTSISPNAFNGFKALTSVKTADGVTSIGRNAFKDCTGLTSVTIPDSVTSIGNSVFSGCTRLESITIPAGVTVIDWASFSGCSSLKSVYIPDSVTNIESSAFSGCKALSEVYYSGNKKQWDVISIASGNDPLTGATIDYAGGSGIPTSGACGDNLTWNVSPDGVLTISGTGKMTDYLTFSSDDSAVVSPFKELEDLNKVIIEPGVTSIGECAFFGCGSITSVTIPDSVTSIGSRAFFDCPGLTGVTIPDSVISIGSYAFQDCSGLTNVDMPEGVTSIENGVFYGCSSLKEITIPSGVKSIGSEAFSSCTALKRITIPSGVTSIGDGAFSRCSGLSGIFIPDGVTSIGGGAFFGCSLLTSITIPDSVKRIGNSAFYETAYFKDSSYWTNDVLYIGNHLIKAKEDIGGEYSIRPGTLCIAEDAFGYCENLSGVTIPDRVISIGSNAFSGCISLSEVVVPEKVTDIASSVFSGCSALKNVTMPAGVTSIGSGAFNGCESLTGVKIPENVTRIGAYAFFGCKSLSDITIPDGVTSIGEEAFSETAYYNDDANWSDGVLYIGNHLIKAKEDIKGDCSIRPGTLCIADNAFFGCEGLKSITIPDSVTSIGSGAFMGTIYYQDDSYRTDGVLYIGEYLIEGDVEGDYTVKVGTRCIANDAFSYCEGLRSVTIPDSVVNIGYGAFRSCSALEGITIADGSNPVRINDYAFYNCSSLTTLSLPDSVSTVGDLSFARCGSVGELKLPASLKQVNGGAFASCGSLENVSLTNSVGSVKTGAFEDCDSLSDVYFKGAETDWNSIDIGRNNEDLTGAALHFDAAPAPTTEPPTKPTSEPITGPMIAPTKPDVQPTTVPSSTPTTQPAQTDGIFIFGGDVSSVETADSVKYASAIALTKSDLAASISGAYDGATVTLKDKDGNEVADDAALGTGSTVTVTLGDTSITKTIVFAGDVDGDATVNATDARLALRAAAKLDTLTGAFAAAADTDGDNNINATDARMILRAAAKLEGLKAA